MSTVLLVALLACAPFPSSGPAPAGMPDDAERIATVVQSARPHVEVCITTATASRPELAGAVTIGWVIDRGAVLDVRVVANTTADDALATCVADVVRALRFPADVSGVVDGYRWVLET